MGLAGSMAREMIREIENKSKEFYEFVLPPVDMYLDGDVLVLQADMPGFEKKDVKISLKGRILDIKACKEAKKGHDMICNQRPDVIDKRIRLPVRPAEDSATSAKYEGGILTVTISSPEGWNRHHRRVATF